jgi:hypothetical protein
VWGLGLEGDSAEEGRKRDDVEDGRRREDVEGEMYAERRRPKAGAATCWLYRRARKR